MAIEGVPETALWTLHHRVLEASRPDAMFADPMARTLRDGIDFPFEERFGAGFRTQTQLLALRVCAFDDAVRRFLADRPNATVVGLGEGLETQFWRVDNGTVRWATVDLPVMTRLRARLLPVGDRQQIIEGSALDLSWMDSVDPTNGILITTQGLLMYLQPDEVHTLIRACAQRFPGGVMVIDTVAPWMARQVARSSGKATGYTPPPLRWCMNSADWPSLRELHPNIASVTEVMSRRGRGAFAWLPANVHRIPVVKGVRGGVVQLTFSGT